MQIVPMRDLKDTVKIEKLCSMENGPVFVTKNGYGRLVVMDIEYFQKTMNKLYEATALKKGIADLEEGQLSDGKAVMEEMRLKYGI